MKVTSYALLLLLIAFTLPLMAADEKAPKPYPLTSCVISGEKLGEMAKPVVFVYEGQEVKLCCKDCKKDFDKDPTAAMKKISDLSAKKSGHSDHQH
ncbi:MAG: hypothetical protein ACAI35_24150 [Candidatus Methylacidiphilales bacterium]|nr:hypothetical protein [Candidatus Methylacidiphilales bacterium]